VTDRSGRYTEPQQVGVFVLRQHDRPGGRPDGIKNHEQSGCVDSGVQEQDVGARLKDLILEPVPGQLHAHYLDVSLAAEGDAQ
jgi:hypothetical protein